MSEAGAVEGPAGLQERDLPPVPPFRKLLGPSFILLGLGLGSGELILWPYLVSNHGLGILWAALVGITLQFFINMEVARYTLVRGESIFAGFAQLSRLLPWWFLVSTFVSFSWPGILAASATALAYVIPVPASVITFLFLFLIGVILTLGPVLYRTVERLQMVLLAVAIPLLVVLAILLVDRADVGALTRGLIGIGEGYTFLPAGISLFVFLGAVAYTGAAGNLNLAQSFYVNDKGYGMGKYSPPITSPWTGRAGRPLELRGYHFPLSSTSLARFRQWWLLMNLEHALVFWFLGCLTVALVALLAYATAFGSENTVASINFVAEEAAVMSERLHAGIGIIFLLLVSLMLFGTQLTVFDSTSRIMAENLALLNIRNAARNLRVLFYSVLWAQLAFAGAITLAGFSEPRLLLTIQSVLAALTMFVHIGLTLLVNVRLLERPLRPGYGRILAQVLAFLFFGGLSAFAFLRSLPGG